jgi:hypothetical protein
MPCRPRRFGRPPIHGRAVCLTTTRDELRRHDERVVYPGAEDRFRAGIGLRTGVHSARVHLHRAALKRGVLRHTAGPHLEIASDIDDHDVTGLARANPASDAVGYLIGGERGVPPQHIHEGEVGCSEWVYDCDVARPKGIAPIWAGTISRRPIPQIAFAATVPGSQVRCAVVEREIPGDPPSGG